MMLPLGRSPEGLTIAVQIVARYGDEATLFRLAAQLEAARPWFERKPRSSRERRATIGASSRPQ